MLSARLLVICALLGAAVALPALDKPQTAMTPIILTEFPAEDFEDSWFRFPSITSLFAPLWNLFPNFAQIGPKVTSNADKFEIVLNVKDFKKDDLKIKVKNQFIIMQGAHETKKEGIDIFESQFLHTYSLPANATVSEIKAQLSSNGYLIVTAPINGPGDKSQNEERIVPIEETGKPYEPVDEKVETSDAEKVEKVDKEPAPPKPEAEESEDDRKEPTTPPNDKQEEATEKDNMIPHGNEVSP